MESKYFLQLEYIDLEDKAIKVDILDKDRKPIRKAHFDYTDLTFTFEKITQDLKLFIDENHFSLENKINIVVTSKEIYSTTIVLPKTSKTKIFIDNEVGDQFKVDYKDNFSLFTSTGPYKKDGTITYVSLIPNSLVKSFDDLAKAINTKIGEITSISLLLAEKEQTNSLISSRKAPHVSVYIRKLYSVINVVIHEQLVSSLVSPFGYKKLTKDNVVKRLDSINHLNSLVLSLCGESELFYKNIPVEDFYLYCKDEVLRNQFINKNLSIPYSFVDDEEFIPDLFKKNVFNLKKIMPKLIRGMTLVEVMISLAIFAISAAAMFSLIWTCYDVNAKDDVNVLKANFINDLYTRFEASPTNYITKLYQNYDISEVPANNIYLDSKFIPTNITAYKYEVDLEALNSELISGSKTKYTQIISSIKDSDSKSIQDKITFVTVK